MAKENYEIGEEASVKGVVTRVDNVNGHEEYTVVVQNDNARRPINIGPKVAPQAFTNGQSELLALNAERDEEVAKESAAAQKELDAAAEKEANDVDAEVVKGDDSPEDIREKTVTPDPHRTPAGQGAKGTLPTKK